MSATAENMQSSPIPALEPKPCAHEACTCQAAPEGDYCGSYCASAKDDCQHGDGCGCGHTGCRRP